MIVSKGATMVFQTTNAYPQEEYQGMPKDGENVYLLKDITDVKDVVPVKCRSYHEDRGTCNGLCEAGHGFWTPARMLRCTLTCA